MRKWVERLALTVSVVLSGANIRKGVQELKILALEQGHIMVCVVSTQKDFFLVGRRDRNYRNNTVLAAYVFHCGNQPGKS